MIIYNRNKKEDSLIINLNKEKLYRNIIDYIYVSKILASFSVVILHTNGKFWHFDYNNYKKYWISANFIECIFYFGVPFFVLCIGATLLNFNERYGLIKYYKKRIEKVVIPLLGWTFILYLFKVYFIKNLNKGKITFVFLWNLYYSNNVYQIFGSFHSFLLLYRIIPLLSYVEKSKKIKVYSYCFITLLLCQSFFPYLITVFGLKLVWIYNINVGYLIYIFAGYIIHNYKFSKIEELIIYILGIFGFLIHIFGTQILTLKYKKIILFHKGYLNIPCILYSCSLFMFIKENSNKLHKLINRKYIIKIGSLTIGPFFMHMPIIDFSLKYFKINTFGLNFRLFGGIFICIICLIITNFFKKIPIINILVP